MDSCCVCTTVFCFVESLKNKKSTDSGFNSLKTSRLFEEILRMKVVKHEIKKSTRCLCSLVNDMKNKNKTKKRGR